MANKTLELIEKDLIRQAKASEWCELAETIIALEFAIRQEQDRKLLKVLNLKLKIFEEEKKIRVSNHFDYDHFRRRELELLTEDMYDFDGW